MRRVLAPLLVAAAILASLPSAAAPGALVVTVDSVSFLPGDDTIPVETLRIQKGSELIYANLDAFYHHSVTSDKCKGASGSYPAPESCPAGKTRLFDSGLLAFRQSKSVPGVPALGAGTYGFACFIHPDMRGNLVVF